MKDKSKGGRPIKLNENIVSTFERIADRYCLPCTDEEVFFMLNDELPQEDRISYTLFKLYKNNGEQFAKDNPELSYLFDRFLSVIKRVLTKEKETLLKSLKAEKGSWQRFAWILERKFDEWNMRSKQDIDHNVNGGGITLVIDQPDRKDDIKRLTDRAE